MRLLWYVSRRSQPSTASPEVGMAFLISKWARMPMTSQVNGTKNGCIMKNFNKIFFAAVAAAFGLASCSQELTPVEKPQGNLVTVNFGAEASIEPATKATLTTEDELTFKSAWENGDIMSVKYSNGNEANRTVPATWNASSQAFEATLPEYTGMWDYNTVYPAPDADGKVDFGSVRTQKGNAYNSNYDLMKGAAIAENAAAGKDDNGKNIIFEMTRQTAVAYFHLTGTLDEEVVSAKLSVEGDGAYISTSDVKANDYAKGYVFTETEGVASKEINLTFDAGTAPKASDFKLWFNVLPTIYTKMTLAVETANHTMTISRTAADMYEAGKLYKVVKAIPADKWVKKGGETPTESSYTIEFNSKTKTVTSFQESTKAETVIVSGLEYVTAKPFSNPSNAYYGGDESNGLPLRIGKSKEVGSITMALSAAGQVNANKIILSAKQFSKGKTFNIGVNDSAKQQPGEDYTDLEFALDGSPLTSIKLDSDGYIFVKSITVVSGPIDNTIPTLSVDQSSKVWAADATDAFVVKVTVNSEGGDWTVTPTTLDWATVAVDKAAGTITVTPNGANTAEAANEAKLTVAHTSDASLTKEITLKQNAAGAVLEKSEIIDLSKGVFASGDKPTITWSGTSCSFVQNQGESTSNVANYTSAPRWYKSHIVSFTANAGYKITKVVVTCTTEAYAKVFTNTATKYSPEATTIATVSSKEVTITTAGDFTITMGAQSRISSVVVYYTE